MRCLIGCLGLQETSQNFGSGGLQPRTALRLALCGPYETISGLAGVAHARLSCCHATASRVRSWARLCRNARSSPHLYRCKPFLSSCISEFHLLHLYPTLHSCTRSSHTSHPARKVRGLREAPGTHSRMRLVTAARLSRPLAESRPPREDKQACARRTSSAALQCLGALEVLYQGCNGWRHVLVLLALAGEAVRKVDEADGHARLLSRPAQGRRAQGKWARAQNRAVLGHDASRASSGPGACHRDLGRACEAAAAAKRGTCCAKSCGA
jgi:hypothetical protein